MTEGGNSTSSYPSHKTNIGNFNNITFLTHQRAKVTEQISCLKSKERCAPLRGDETEGPGLHAAEDRRNSFLETTLVDMKNAAKLYEKP